MTSSSYCWCLAGWSGMMRIVRGLDLVVIAVRGQHLVQGLLDGDAVEAHRVRLVDELLIELDVDPRRGADEVQDVLEAGRGAEVQPDWLARARIEKRRRVLAARLGPEL